MTYEIKIKPLNHKTLLRKSRDWRNFEAQKKQEDRKALLKYGFSNTGECPKPKVATVEIRSKAGLITLFREVLP